MFKKFVTKNNSTDSQKSLNDSKDILGFEEPVRKSEFLEQRNSGIHEQRNSGIQEPRKNWIEEQRNSRIQEPRNTGTQEQRNSGIQEPRKNPEQRKNETKISSETNFLRLPYRDRRISEGCRRIGKEEPILPERKKSVPSQLYLGVAELNHQLYNAVFGLVVHKEQRSLKDLWKVQIFSKVQNFGREL